jgi:hypothetical protein
MALVLPNWIAHFNCTSHCCHCFWPSPFGSESKFGRIFSRGGKRKDESLIKRKIYLPTTVKFRKCQSLKYIKSANFAGGQINSRLCLTFQFQLNLSQNNSKILKNVLIILSKYFCIVCQNQIKFYIQIFIQFC